MPMSDKLLTVPAYKWIVAVLLLAYTCIQSYCIHRLSLNYDEGSFLSYGASLLKLEGNKDVAKFDSKLPITMLNALPRAVQQIFHPLLKKNDSIDDVLMGRYISLSATILLALLIFQWGSLLYNKTAGLCSFMLFLACPNFLAHGIFVSSDIFACLFITAALFYLWRFSGKPNIRTWVLVCCSTALAEISKFSMVHLLLLIPLLLLISSFYQRTQGQSFDWRRFFFLLLIFTFVNWLVISAAHLFYGMFIPLDNYQFKSGTFQQLQQLFPHFPVPFPSPYIKSMDAVIYFDHLGGGAPGSLNGPPYILGTSQAHGFWYYYFVVLFFKLPLASWVLLIFTMVTYFYRPKWKNFFSSEMYLLIPVLYFLVYLGFFYSTQLGIRHIIIILPLLYILTGFLFAQNRANLVKYCVYMLIFLQFMSVAVWFPHFLPYTNELIPDKKMAYTKIADTNLCYGEGEKFLLAYMKQHPQAKYLPVSITPGVVIMEVNEMLNLNIATMGKFDWVRGLKPVDHIHCQYLVFEVTAAMADSLKKNSGLK
jgi:hypothetical protein